MGAGKSQRFAENPAAASDIQNVFPAKVPSTDYVSYAKGIDVMKRFHLSVQAPPSVGNLVELIDFLVVYIGQSRSLFILSEKQESVLIHNPVSVFEFGLYRSHGAAIGLFGKFYSLFYRLRLNIFTGYDIFDFDFGKFFWVFFRLIPMDQDLKISQIEAFFLKNQNDIDPRATGKPH
jgi:hypothetical protein